jgi:hypothetical protein
VNRANDRPSAVVATLVPEEMARRVLHDMVPTVANPGRPDRSVVVVADGPDGAAAGLGGGCRPGRMHR